MKKSVDARKKDKVCFICALEAQVRGEDKLLSRLRTTGCRRPRPTGTNSPRGSPWPSGRWWWASARRGCSPPCSWPSAAHRPIVLERGLPVEQREKSVETFWREGRLDPESNVQFGEGGAGAFSDGKLTTGTGDERIRKVLEELAAAGAPQEILTDAKPHIGTDKLPGAVRAIREKILALGGEVRFSCKVVGFRRKGGALSGLEVETAGRRQVVECSQAILAVGHSARDVFRLLEREGLPLQAKAFSVGARIEHPRELIDRAQYGSFAGHPALGAADYKLSCHLENGRGVYTFCMCPGGTVTGAASEEGGVVTNGMSPWARDGEKQQRRPAGGGGPPGLRRGRPPWPGWSSSSAWRRRLSAWRGGAYAAPAQRVEDFLSGRGRASGSGRVLPTYQPGVVPSDLRRCLPQAVTESMGAALPRLGRQLKGFDWGEALLTRAGDKEFLSRAGAAGGRTCRRPGLPGLYPCGEGAGFAGGIVSAAVDGPALRRSGDGAGPAVEALLTGPETRSSSPVRVLRGEDLQSPGLAGLYPCGEGAGFAGGIVSAAVDGLRCAEAVMAQGRR